MKRTDELSRQRFKRLLEKKFSAAEVKGNLVAAGLFLVAYELLRSEIVEAIKGFYFVGNCRQPRSPPARSSRRDSSRGIAGEHSGRRRLPCGHCAVTESQLPAQSSFSRRSGVIDEQAY